MSKIIINRDTFRDKVMGCWLGKNAGGTLGEPVEGKFGRDEMFHLDWYPYLPEGGIPNDDLELQLIWLQLLMRKGPGITASDFVEAWTDCIAYNFDEYGLCKENMQKGLLPPVCGWHNNAFKDCMGSPIRSEIWACLAPGSPELAARYAFQDAIVDHGGGESVYGEIFNAVLESAAFVNNDKFELLGLALSAIPKDSRTYRCVKRCMDNFSRGMSYVDNRNDLKDRFYNPVAQYSPLNLGFQTIGWLYGTDFGDSICKAVNCGWDTDCTAATLGAILGIIGGASSLPEKWIKPLGNEIATNMSTGGIRNLTAPTDISELTGVVMEQAERVAAYWECGVRFTDEEPQSCGVAPAAPDMSWMSGYRADTIPFAFGGLREELAYDGDAAILGDRASNVTLRIFNPHPIEKNVTAALLLPEGFSAVPDGPGMLKLPPEGRAELTFSITAQARAIRETNRGFITLSVDMEPALPALPVVLLGGSHWLISPFYPGKTLEEDCGVREDTVFREPPEGFTPQWNPGNSLEVGPRFKGKGVLYALHHIFAEEEKEVVLGVPNNGYMKLFLNGKQIHQTKERVPLRANLGNGGALGDMSNYRVTEFLKGWNQVLIKLENDREPQEAHFTLGGMSRVCEKNHGMPVLGIRRSGFLWD